MNRTEYNLVTSLAIIGGYLAMADGFRMGNILLTIIGWFAVSAGWYTVGLYKGRGYDYDEF